MLRFILSPFDTITLFQKLKFKPRKLTMGTLYKPKTVEMAMERVEEESPTIPMTGGLPLQESVNSNCSSSPLIKDNAARNPMASLTQLSYML